MEEIYPVVLGGEKIGSAAVTRKGLYLKILCRCRLSADVLYKVLASCGDREFNLGILVPGEDGFTLETSFPIKKLGDGPYCFRAVPRHISTDGKFVPIYPEEPFSYLQKLKQAYLEIRDGQIGLRIP
ncbi:MAG: hypothetical protein IJO56_06580 [Oscillospiraceae bacterium]|nr:hypothetical protein [Oscillospiraceae bacterium]